MPRIKRRHDDDDDDEDGSDSSRFSESEDDDEEDENDEEEEDVPAIGDVGYQFRKQFSTGWFTGVVKAIVQNSEEPEYNRRCVYNDGDAEDLRLVDLVKLHKLDPRINPRIGNAKSTINRVNSEGLFDSDSSDAKSENGLPRRIGGKKNHGSVEAGAKDVLSFNLDSDPEFNDDANNDDDDNSSNDGDDDDDDDNSDDEVDSTSGTIGISDKRDDDVALTMDDERFAKAVRKFFQGKPEDSSWKRLGDTILMELKQYGGRILHPVRSSPGGFSPIIGYALLNDVDARKKIATMLQNQFYNSKQRNATDENDSDEDGMDSRTIDIAQKREDDVALTMEDERFADAVRRYNQGTQDDCRSVAEKIFKRLKKYGGRLLQTHRSGAGRSPIIGFTSLNDVDAKERIQVMLSKSNMYRTNELAQHHSSTDDDDDDDAVEANSPTGTIGIADKRDDDVAITIEDEKFAKAVRTYLSGNTDKSSKRVAKLVLMEIKKYGGRLLQTHRSGTGRSPIVGYTPLSDVDAKGRIETLVHHRKTYYRRNATNQKDSNEANSTVDISKKREDDVALTMDDERFADAVRRYNQGTQDDCRSVAEKIFKRLKKYGGRLLQTHRSGAGRSPIIGYTSLNDVDAKERIISILHGNKLYRNSKGDEKKTSKKNDLSHLKPVFEFGEDVCAAWWHKDMDVKDGSNAQWFYGKVSSYREKDKGSPYGPLRFYDILFNDGDVSEGYGKSGLEEHWVMSSEDYDIYMEERDWIGVRNERDDLVREHDLWPKMVGWYVVSGIILQPSGKVVTVDGDDRTYSRLSDAMKAYDMSVIRLKGIDTHDSELNRPQEKKEYLKQIRLEELSLDQNSLLSAPPQLSRVKKNKNKKKKKKIVPTYKGVSYRTHDAKFLAEIDIDGQLHCLGPYTFQADAALAYDKGREFLFTRPDPNGSNFSTMSKYEEAIRTEMASVNRNANVTKRNDKVTKIVQSYIAKIYNVEPRRMQRTSYAEIDDDLRDKDDDDSDDESMDSSGHGSVCVERRDDVLDRFFARGSTSHEESTDDHLADQARKPKAKYSIFTGVYKSGKSSRSQIFHSGRKYELGTSWKLQADAALAYDKACKLLKGANFNKLNFTSRQSYLSYRAKEIKKLEDRSQKVIIDPVPLVLSNIQHHLRSIMSSEIDALNENFAEKWGEHVEYLPSMIVGQDYHSEYQKSFNMLFANVSVDDSSPFTTSPNNSCVIEEDEQADCITKDTEIDNIHDVFIRPEESSEDAKNRYDDDASLFSSVHEASDMECSKTESPRPSDVGGAHQNDPILSEEMEVEADQIKMPVGCPVMWNFVGDSVFRSGTITSELDERAMYEVTPTNKGRSDSNKFVPASELAFGIGCPVFVSPTGGQGVQPLQGNVLFCTRSQDGSFVYTVVIIKGQNELQVLKGMSAIRLRYRMVDSGVALMPAKTNNLVLPNNLQAVMPPPSPRLVPSPADGENESGIFFSSNSTITTDCSATPSSRRLFGDSISTSSQDVMCRVYFPHWLVKNNSSRNRLFSYLRQTDSIGTRMACSLNIIEEGYSSYVLIRAKQGRYSTENIRKAAMNFERALLEYVGRHDGSVGRLFYDLARSCEFLYPLGGPGSTSVQQRNPFSTKREMGWMNIVDIPVDRAHEIGLFIISKRIGLLRQMSSLGCLIKVCGNLSPMIATKFCAPYICVISDRPGQVDEAVAILRDAIRNRYSTFNSTQPNF